MPRDRKLADVLFDFSSSAILRGFPTSRVPSTDPQPRIFAAVRVAIAMMSGLATPPICCTTCRALRIATRDDQQVLTARGRPIRAGSRPGRQRMLSRLCDVTHDSTIEASDAGVAEARDSLTRRDTTD